MPAPSHRARAPRRRPRHRGDDLRLLRAPHRAHADQARRRRRLGQLRHGEGARALPAPTLTTQDLIESVRRAGYDATLPAPTLQQTPTRARCGCSPRWCSRCRSCSGAWCRRRGSPGWEWWSLLLSGVVVWWCGWQFHRAAAVNARHGASTMDTLVSLGTVAAWVWSAVAVVRGEGHLYLESAAVVTTFLLAGRYAEGLSKRRAGEALRSLMELGAKQVSLLDDAGETARRRRGAPGRRPVRRTPGREGRYRRCRRGRRRRPSTSPCSPASRCRSRSVRATRWSGPRSTPPDGWWCAPPASAPTPSWPRSPAWSRRRSAPRPPSSGSPTASRRSSCRSCW